MKWFEDIETGETLDLGSHRFEADDIVAFARDYDPQPFHLSEEAGKASLFGGLAASGWHTAGIFMRLLVGAMERAAALHAAEGRTPPAYGPSPGFEGMKWPVPVLAGDTVTYRSECVAKRATGSRPGWGLVTYRHRGVNQRGDLVFEFTGPVFVPMRPAGT